MKVQESVFIERLGREMKLRNYSLRTIKSYSINLSKVEDFYHLPIDKITIPQLKDFLYHRLTKDNISVSLVNQTISAYKIIQEDVLGKEWEPIRIKRPRMEKKLPTVLNVDEIEKLLYVTSNIKHKSLIALAYSSGLRREEVRLLKPSDIDSQSMRVRVNSGKGKKDRYTILSLKALELLRIYYQLQRPENYLFEASGKKGKCLAGSTLNAIVKQAATKAAINKNISFHTLRHCFATHLLEKGTNLRLIQQFMGHSSLKTTSIYLHVADINPRAVISPLDNMEV